MYIFGFRFRAYVYIGTIVLNYLSFRNPDVLRTKNIHKTGP